MQGCPFCELPEARIRIEGEHGLVVRDGYPVAAGHLLIVPRRHVESIFHLSEPEQDELWSLTARARGLLIREARPEGFTIGINDGLAAGQTVPHAHIHVIPRQIGDVADPTGGIRAIVSPRKARYWEHS
ncbi:MAG: HIT domain-containing protein [Gemmatimonadales bacterium]|jgi:diadenosine tetraphosphate (Ap4A) HIT family hydrolase